MAATGESAYLSVRGPAQSTLCIAQVEGTHAVRHRSWVGHSVPLDDTAAGAAIRGDVPDEGYVVYRSTLEPDVTAIAAPILSATGSPLGALSIVGPTYRIDDDAHARLGGLRVLHTRALSEALRHATPSRKEST
ncbi:IclR family transcriptional regulator C-terminal domain-containing protein [Streptomyces sp. NPDC057963]|uniref:IclR family transcriptional regulator domain-containing protein n=1 Tax=Streptomyces sp. NPDC057963 TaxID=3346290 RepID=UPI0036EDD773